MKPVNTCLLLLALLGTMLMGTATAERSDLWATIVLRDGSTLDLNKISLCTPRYTSRYTYCWGGQNLYDIGGAPVPIPLAQISRFDLTQLDWRQTRDRFSLQATLKDGRIVNTFANDGCFYVQGINEFGSSTELRICPGGDPATHPFTSLIIGTEDGPPALGTSATSPPSSPAGTTDTIRLRNGDVLSGTILTDTFTMRTSYATLTFQSTELHSITIESAAGKTDRIQLKAGDQLSGVIENETLTFRLLSGTEITLERGQIENITFRSE